MIKDKPEKGEHPKMLTTIFYFSIIEILLYKRHRSPFRAQALRAIPKL
jgi:hypothetical protein